MMLDCILNTALLSQNRGQTSPWAFQCNLQIVITVLAFFGVMIVYFARMWRVYKVFNLYQDYLSQQKANLEKEIEIETETTTEQDFDQLVSGKLNESGGELGAVAAAAVLRSGSFNEQTNQDQKYLT